MTRPAEPDHHAEALWAAYLDFFREEAIAKVALLEPKEQRRTRLPSGWTPLELLSHLFHMEQRWLVWGFLGESVAEVWGDWNTAEPWADEDADEPRPAARWVVPDDVTAEQLADRLRALGRRTTEILASYPPMTVAVEGPRFGTDPATLEWICFHVLQEYARHMGHLDIAVELAAGSRREA